MFRTNHKLGSDLSVLEGTVSRGSRSSKRIRRYATIAAGALAVAGLTLGLASSASATAVGSVIYNRGSISCTVIEDGASKSLDMTFPLPTDVQYIHGMQYVAWRATIWRLNAAKGTWTQAYVQTVHVATTGMLINSTTLGHLGWDGVYHVAPAEAVNVPAGYTYEVTGATYWFGAKYAILATSNVLDARCVS